MDMRIHLTTNPGQQYEILMINDHFWMVAALILGLCLTGWGIFRHRRQHWFRKSILVIANAALVVTIFLLLMPVNKSTSDALVRNHVYTTGVSPQQVARKVAAEPDHSHWLSQSLVATWQQQGISADDLLDNEAVEAAHIKNLQNWYWQTTSNKPLVIHGHGYLPHQYQQANINQIQFQNGAEVLPGFNRLQWHKQTYLGQSWQLTGFVQGDKQQPFHLELTDPGGEIVAQVTDIANGQAFTMSVPSDVAGRLVYQLSLYPKQSTGGFENSGTDAQLAKEPLAIESIALSVVESSPLMVMMIQSSPSFETRHLKNYLQGQGHQVIIRTRISQDKFLTQSSNIDSNSPRLANDELLIEPELLKQVDLLVVDGRTIEELTEQQRLLVQGALAEGLGVFVIGDTSMEVTSLQQLSGVKVKQVETKPVQVNANTGNLLFSALNGEKFDLLNYQHLGIEFENQTALIISPTAEPVVTSTKNRQGRITLSSLANAYQWQLSSNQQAFQGYWQFVIESTARFMQKTEVFPQSDQDFLMVNQQDSICFKIPAEQYNQANSAVLQAIAADGKQTKVPLLNKISHSGQYCGSYYPQIEGWHHYKLYSNNDLIAGQWRYAYAPTSFNEHLNYQRQRASESLSLDQAKLLRPLQSEASESQNFQPYNKFWIWIAMIFIAGSLWFERKLYNQSPKKPIHEMDGFNKSH